MSKLLISIFLVSFCLSKTAFSLLVDKTNLWPDPGNLRVCWEPVDRTSVPYDIEERRRWIREAIDEQWGSIPDTNLRFQPKRDQVGGGGRRLFRFYDWSECPSSPNATQRFNIRLGLDPVVGRTNGFGKEVDGKVGAVIFPLDLEGLLGFCEDPELSTAAQCAVVKSCLLSPNRYKECVQTTAVHEFGHALGFQHEQCRSDVPFETGRDFLCNILSSNDSRVYGDFDDYGTMNYRYNSENMIPTLSRQDRMDAWLAYSGQKGRRDIGRPLIKTIQDGVPTDAILNGVPTNLEIQYFRLNDPSLVPGSAQLTLVHSSSGRVHVVNNCSQWNVFDYGAFSYITKTCSWKPQETTQYDVRFNNTVAIPILNVTNAIGQITNKTAQVNQPAQVEVLVKTATTQPFTVSGLLTHSITRLKIPLKQKDCRSIESMRYVCQLGSGTRLPQNGTYLLRVLVQDAQRHYAKIEDYLPV